MTSNPVTYTELEMQLFYHSQVGVTISYARFVQRVKTKGWNLERAISAPVHHTTRRSRDSYEFYQKTPVEKRKVSYKTFYGRISNGWEKERAISTPMRSSTTALQQVYDNHPSPNVDFFTFYTRVYKYKWDVQRAITTALPERSKSKRISPAREFYDANKERAAVASNIFLGRVHKNWSLEKALTTPKIDLHQRSSQNRIFYNQHPSPEVCYQTYLNRVNRLGWEQEAAITTPPTNDRERSAWQDVTPTQAAVCNKIVTKQNLRSFYELHKDTAEVSFNNFMYAVTKQRKSLKNALKSPYRQPSNAWFKTLHAKLHNLSP